MEFWIDFSGYFKVKAESEKEAERIALDILSDFAVCTDGITNCNYTIEEIEETDGND